MSTEFINDQWRLPNNENKDKQSNYSMGFDAASLDYIDCGNFDPTQQDDNGSLPYSISLWVNITYTGGTQMIVSKQTNSGSYNGFSVSCSNVNISFSLGSGLSPQARIIGSASFSGNFGSWTNICLTYDGSRDISGFNLYFNGQNQTINTTANQAPQNVLNTANFEIGSRDGGNILFNGKIDAVSIFNYALTDGTGGTVNQIATLYGSSSTGIGNPMSLSPKPVAYYPLGDQDAFNGANYLVPNSSLKDYVFDFDTSKIVTTNSLGLTQEITVSAWVKIPNGSSGGNAPNIQALVSEDSTGGTTRNFGLSWRASTLKDFLFEVFSTDGTRQYLYSNAGDVNDGKWHHVVGTWDGTTNTNAFKIYVDKVVTSTTATKTGINIQSNVATTIGANAITGTWPFEGNISNVQIWDKNLSSTEVETLYNNGSPIETLANIPQNSSLQGWWKLDASATYDSSTTTWSIPDSSSNSNTGTSSGMTQANLVQSDLSFTSGYSPYALDFDGVDDYIDLGTDSSLDIFNGDFSVSLWFKHTMSSGSARAMIEIGASSYSANMAITFGFQSNTGVGFAVGGNWYTNAGSGYNDGNWHHMVATRTGTTYKIYIDSQEITASVPSGGYSYLTLNTIGKGKFGGNFDGKLSNISMWNTALTSAQVSEIYNEGVPSNLNNHSAYSNLVSWWQLGSNTSWVDPYWIALDEKGTNNGQSQNVAAPNNMGESAIVDGVGSYANGVGTSGLEVIGSAPFSDANSLSVNMDVLDRSTDVPN